MLIPIFIVYRDTGGLDVLLALIPLYMVMVLPFTVWTMRGFIAAVPVELEEAALVDGCSRGQAFRRIVFPLLAPGVMATSLFGFITIWNEFVFVNALMQSEPNATLPLWISAFQTIFGTDWGATMAASTLFTLPVVVVFAALQRRAIGGLAAGAVKG
jgi:N,N'-diacetylchitobiose transport system permease protein